MENNNKLLAYIPVIIAAFEMDVEKNPSIKETLTGKAISDLIKTIYGGNGHKIQWIIGDNYG